jgi:hypothetical protein
VTEVRVDASIFQCGHLERLPLRTPYPAIVMHVGRLLARLPAGTALAIDFTGVGRPVFDMFTAAGLSPIGVLITGGATETHNGAIVGVPKLTLVSRLQALLHEGRLKIHRDLAEAATLVRELQDFRVQFTDSGSMTFNARSGAHDDLVLALAIAAWRAYGSSGPGAGIFEYYRQKAAALTGIEEPARTVVGVDLGQAHDPTAIAVVRRVPATRIETRPDPPPKPQPSPVKVYAKGSVEYEEARQRAAAQAAEDPWLPVG